MTDPTLAPAAPQLTAAQKATLDDAPAGYMRTPAGDLRPVEMVSPLDMMRDSTVRELVSQAIGMAAALVAPSLSRTADRVRAALSDRRVVEVLLPDGEQYKNLQHVSRVLDVLIANAFGRDCQVLALGGTLVVGTVFIALNLLSDLLYRVLDPRTRDTR